MEPWCAREDGQSRGGRSGAATIVRGDGVILIDRRAIPTDAQGLPDLHVGQDGRAFPCVLLGVRLGWFRGAHCRLGHDDGGWR